MMKRIGYARVSTSGQDTDRQVTDLLAAGVRRDDLYTDQGVSGARASRPAFDRALTALEKGDTLVVTTLDRLGRSTANMLSLAAELRGRAINLKVLNLGGGAVDTATPMGSMTFTVMAALAQMELDIKRERITDSVSKRRAAGKDLGGRRAQFTDSQVMNARRLIDGGQPGTQVARDLGMSRATMYRRMAQIQAREWIGSQTE
ncbi:DNA invertase Pin-like site-specific DNA recombinase [Arthrobacter silviterrae]|uniref:Recombinase family protein n=1 Tax=Arthrobacter silviterrae TaxID=2026658 RepID=A0ABX0DLK8_9MICC|nr:recombinase family protein [Arthrobacter silviterrae]MDQ0277458.1 DNA invertase Pin-like site-specific DNA recombinase [Arthrobacter silviterrae]NGN85595.1 recombinase family protein [Arthrobacter silviterrae]